MKATRWLASVALWTASNAQSVTRNGLKFELNGNPFAFAGANTWDSMRVQPSKVPMRLKCSSRIP